MSLMVQESTLTTDWTLAAAERWRERVILGWAGMLSLLLTMCLVELFEAAMSNEFSQLASDPGRSGLWFIVIVASLNVAVRIFIRTFDGRGPRWIGFGATMLYALTFVGHQLVHFAAGSRVDYHFVLDSCHHLVGGWATLAAYRWARAPYVATGWGSP